jgi:hypothetical protein
VTSKSNSFERNMNLDSMFAEKQILPAVPGAGLPMNSEGGHRKPVAAFARSGCDHELAACAPVRHETRMRCPGRCPHREGIGAGDHVAVTRSSMCLVSVLCSSGRITVLSPSCVIDV